jgi:endonuclease/exonuclease/phosphatase family metal-dependent hydrolase
MAFSFRKLSKRFFIIVNALIALALLLACLQPWLNPETFWFMGFFGIAFPYLLILLVAFLVFWLFVKPPFILIGLVTIGIAWKQIDALFNLQKQKFSYTKPADQLRVLSWNVKAFQGFVAGSKEDKYKNAKDIFNLIERLDPDIVCFQEFGQYDSPSVKRDYIGFMKKIGFDHYVLSKDYNRVTFGYSSGLAIFSKTPFLHTKKIPFTSSPESVLYADIVFKTDTIRVFTTHLQSYKFSRNDYKDIEKIKNSDDSIYSASRNIFSKMKRAFRNRGGQADMIRPLLDSCPYPELVTCDMNDVPTSYAYWQLRGDRRDAFLEKGFGIGRSFMTLAPSLRIDYIMADTRFQVNQFEIIKKKYSDHLPLVADVYLQQPAP